MEFKAKDGRLTIWIIFSEPVIAPSCVGKFFYNTESSDTKLFQLGRFLVISNQLLAKETEKELGMNPGPLASKAITLTTKPFLLQKAFQN